MNREALYLEIGKIDDDLIMEASRAKGRKKGITGLIRWGSIAACLCLLCMGAILGVRREVIFYHEVQIPVSSKVMIPPDAEMLTLSERELADYYGLASLPETLADLQRTEAGQYTIYRNAQGVVYDTNFLSYRSADRAQTLSVWLTKEDRDGSVFEAEAKQSRIAGVPLLLGTAVSGEESALPVCWAEITEGDTSVYIIAYGMEEPAFTETVRAWIRAQK